MKEVIKNFLKKNNIFILEEGDDYIVCKSNMDRDKFERELMNYLFTNRVSVKILLVKNENDKIIISF